MLPRNNHPLLLLALWWLLWPVQMKPAVGQTGSATGMTGTTSTEQSGEAAAFPNDRVLQVTIRSSVGGQVTTTNLTHASNPNGPYTYEDVIQLLPVANTGYTFVEWHGPVVTTNTGGVPTYTVTVHNDLYIEARFARTTTYAVTVRSATNGSVVMHPPDSAGRPRNGLAADTYPRSEMLPANMVVHLTAVPSGEYLFDRWLGSDIPAGCERTNPLEITVNGTKNFAARFTAAPLLDNTLKNKAVKLYFQGQTVGGIIHLKRNGGYETLSTTPTAGQTAQQAFDGVKNFILNKVDFVQSLQLQRYDPVYHVYRTESVDPPAPIFSIDYYSNCNTTRDGDLAARITADIAAASTVDAKNQLENAFLHGRWTDPTNSANRLFFQKTNSLPYLTNPSSVFRNYLADTIVTYLAGHSASSGVFLDDVWVQPPLCSWTQRNITSQPCFNANRGDIHAANTFTAGPNGTTIVTLRSVPGKILTTPIVTLNNDSTLTATDFTNTADTTASDTTYTCQATLGAAVSSPDFTISYGIEDPIVFDTLARDHWLSNTLEMVSYMRSRIPANKLVVYNPRNRGAAGSDGYVAAGSGCEDEYFIHSFYFDLNWRTTPADWKQSVDDLARMSANRIFLAQSGTSEDYSADLQSSIQTDLSRLAMFLYSSFLLGKGPYGYFNFDTPANGQAGSNYHYFDFYNLDIQAPLGGYCALDSSTPVQPADPVLSTIYTRRFANALVLVNPASWNGASIPFSISNATSNFNTMITQEGLFQYIAASTLQGTLPPQSALIFTRMDVTASMPAITSQSPAQQTLRVGDSATLYATATGVAPLTYQWQLNGKNIPGATSATYFIPSLSLLDSGDYCVRVTNETGMAVSTTITLTVVLPPSIVTQPTNQSVRLGGTVSFHVAAAGSAPLAYQWRKAGAVITNTGPFSGVATDMLTISNVTASEASTYDCVVSNPGGSVICAGVTLTIDASALNFISAATRCTHGAAGTFDLAVPLWQNGQCALESRAGASLVMAFDRDLTATEQASLSLNGQFTCGNGLTCLGNMVAVSLLDDDCQGYSITGLNITARTFTVRVVKGDADLDGAVNVIDLVAIRDHSNEPLGQTNFTNDVNADGRIDVLDMVYIRDQINR